MTRVNISLARRQGNIAVYLDDRRCEGCVIGCTGGCSTCDVLDGCDVCPVSNCRDCDVRADCDTCRCNGCDGCPYED